MTTTKTKLPAEIKHRDLRVRDAIACFDGPWSTAVIARIDNEQVFIERPYGITDERGSLLIGVERFSVYRDSDRTFTVLRRPSDD